MVEFNQDKQRVFDFMEKHRAKGKTKMSMPKKMVLEENDYFYGEFVRIHKVKRVDTNNQPQAFDSYIFIEYPSENEIYLTGAALGQIDWEAGKLYAIQFNGMGENEQGRPYKNFKVELLPDSVIDDIKKGSF